jgi:predicted metal-binding membrane protein
MWMLMMFAMMLPVVAPMLAAYADIAKNDPSRSAWGLRVTAFAAGYGLLWGAFAVTAALLQLALRDGALLRMGGTLAAPATAAALLVVAGVYQWLPLKEACLRHCRSPMAFLLANWRSGLGGAFRLGARHGWFCLGCCVALMGLMFVFGTMAFWGMALLAAYCVAERLLPAAERWGLWVGAMLVAAGIAVYVRGGP